MLLMVLRNTILRVVKTPERKHETRSSVKAVQSSDMRRVTGGIRAGFVGSVLVAGTQLFFLKSKFK